MSSTSLEIADPEAAQLATLFAGNTPSQLIPAATDVADRLHDVITRKHLSVRIGNSEHVRIEGWQACGTLVGVFATEGAGVTEIPWPEIDAEAEPALARAKARGLAFGFKASYRAEKNGLEVGWGEGRVTRSERNWQTRDDYALASMAQTRGQSRALRQPLGFVVSLAGYDATPAEEMDSPPPVAEAFLTDEQVREVVRDLADQWPDNDAWRFMEKLSSRFGGPFPEAAGAALRAWAWWVGRPPREDAESPQTPAGEAPEGEAPQVAPEDVPPSAIDAQGSEVMTDAEVVPDEPETDPDPIEAQADPTDADFDWGTEG